MVQFDLDEPAGQELGGREGGRVQDPDPVLPVFLGQLPGDGTEGHGRAGQVGHEVLGLQGRAFLDAGDAGLRAGIGGAVLAGPGTDQQVAHRVGAAGHVAQNVRAGPVRQQRRLPQVGLGDDAGRVEQALGRVIDLVVELALRGVHLPTV